MVAPEIRLAMFSRSLDNDDVLVYNGAGHAMHLDHPVRLNRDLAEFVRSVH